jgi:SAM-dependent methyltransferase
MQQGTGMRGDSFESYAREVNATAQQSACGMIGERYLMDDPREASHLIRKVDPQQWVARYLSRLLPRAGDVLEVGCGPGVIACAVARERPTLTVTGVDISPARFACGAADLPPNVILRQADAVDLPFADGKFDVVYRRFLFEYLTDKQAAVNEAVRVCGAGGKVLLQDLDGQLVWHFPEDAELQEGLRCVLDALGRRGFEPFVGRKLFSFCQSAGLTDIRVSAESYPLYAGPIDDHNLRLWQEKFDIALPVAASVLGGETAALALRERFLSYLRRDDSLSYSVILTVEGTKPVIDEKRIASLTLADHLAPTSPA